MPKKEVEFSSFLTTTHFGSQFLAQNNVRKLEALLRNSLEVPGLKAICAGYNNQRGVWVTCKFSVDPMAHDSEYRQFLKRWYDWLPNKTSETRFRPEDKGKCPVPL